MRRVKLSGCEIVVKNRTVHDEDNNKTDDTALYGVVRCHRNSLSPNLGVVQEMKGMLPRSPHVIGGHPRRPPNVPVQLQHPRG